MMHGNTKLKFSDCGCECLIMRRRWTITGCCALGVEGGGVFAASQALICSEIVNMNGYNWNNNCQRVWMEREDLCHSYVVVPL